MKLRQTIVNYGKSLNYRMNDPIMLLLMGYTIVDFLTDESAEMLSSVTTEPLPVTVESSYSLACAGFSVAYFEGGRTELPDVLELVHSDVPLKGLHRLLKMCRYGYGSRVDSAKRVEKCRMGGFLTSYEKRYILARAILWYLGEMAVEDGE